MLAIERVCDVAAESGVSARYTDGTFTFTLDQTGSRQLAWTVDGNELERLAVIRRRQARTVLGTSDGWALLLTHLQEQLETFTGDRGVVVATTDGRLGTTDSGTERTR